MAESSTRRPALPTSSIAFALPSSSSSSTQALTSDDAQTSPLFLRFRRPSIATLKTGFYSEKRINSPLALVAHSKQYSSGEESESDRDRMWTDASTSSSENATPPIPDSLAPQYSGDGSSQTTERAPPRPSTPPRSSFVPADRLDVLKAPTRSAARRLSIPLKPPRILNLLAESRPDETEVQSEAAFQRLIASCSELPTQPRTPRAPSDRGRYPEEAGHEDIKREESPSDDEDGDVDGLFAFEAQSESINLTKPYTPAQSVNGEDMSLNGSPVVGFMDVDFPLPSPSISSTPASIQWRYTPPPTTSAVRSTKRKFDDRFDPYPTASKRRAVSPSVSYLRESHPSFAPRTPVHSSRLVVPIAIPVSSVSSTVANSAASSPTVMHGSRPVSMGTISALSSPIMRPTLGLASPVLRPLHRSRRGLDGEDKEVEGAGEAVNGLSLA